MASEVNDTQARVAWKSNIVPALASALLLLVHGFADANTTLTQRVLGGLLGCLGILAGWRYLQLEKYERLPVPELAAAQMYVLFGMPTITTSLSRGAPVSTEAITSALIASMLFISCALIVSGLGVRLGAALAPWLARLVPARAHPSGRVLFPPWVLLVGIANAGLLLRLPMSVRFFASLVLGVSGVLVYAGLAQYHAGNKSSSPTPPTRELMFIAAALGAAGLLSGMLEQVLRPLFVAIALVLVLYRRVPFSWLVAGMILFAVLNPAKHVFRSQQSWGQIDKFQTASSDSEVLDPQKAAELWWDAIEATWSDNEVSRNNETTLDRLNLLSSTARTVDYAGRRVPFDEGSRWHLIPLTVVPRIINPDKPNMTREFNDRYNYLFGLQSKAGSRATTVALPLIADGYWNFGWVGVILVAVIAGLYWGIVSALWYPANWTLCWVAMCLFVRTSASISLYGLVGGAPATLVGVGVSAWIISALVAVFAPSDLRSRAA